MISVFAHKSNSFITFRSLGRCTMSTSKRHFERRLLRYTSDQLFLVVADVKSYSQFVPWCVSSTVRTTVNKNRLEADLEVGFGSVREKYTSNVYLVPNIKISTDSSQTSFIDKLTTLWTFTPGEDPKTCWVTFQIDFKFKSIIYSKISDLFFQDIVDNMVKAFEKRCLHVYGPTNNTIKEGKTIV